MWYTGRMGRSLDEIPVKKNQTVTLEIDALGSEGQGVGRFGGFVVFVPFALPGETVEARVIKVTPAYAVGKLLSVAQRSPDRVEPRCGAFLRCGGCQLQHMDYAAQLEFKRAAIRDAFRKIGGVEADVLPVAGMDEPWRYRNKGIFPVGNAGGGLAMGMYAPRSHTIVDVEDCPLQHEDATQAMAAVRRWAVENGISAYDEAAGEGLLRAVMVRAFRETGQAVAVVVTNGEALPAAGALVDALRSAVPGLTGVVQNVNAERTNVVLGCREKTLWGEPAVRARLGALEYDVAAASFFQVNSAQMAKLYEAAAEAAGLTGRELVVDAYCGVGTIGQYLARRAGAGRVVGIESVPRSVEEAKRSAARNSIQNVEYVCGKAEDVFRGMAAKGLRPDVIVMDPPRKGCDEKFLDAVAASGAARLVYVSCNPATMARDVKYLMGKGYALGPVRPVDMFPQTADVECVAGMHQAEGNNQ
jgi:23S rRNA (uracil1939-C5)-methyltransferase